MDTGRRNQAERRLSAIFAADVAGYSRLIGIDEEGTLDRLKLLRLDLIEPKIAAHRGRLVKTTGDGLLVEFASVLDALRCASEIQTAMRERGEAEVADQRIEFRVGIHQGDIVVDGDDILGDGVNVAARLEALAEPGGICVSARVQEDAAGRLDLAFEDMGEQSLKNIARPVRVYRVRSDRKTPVAVDPVSAPPLPDRPSIAVLPFQNMSGDPEQEYFADGMVEEIITALSKVRWFFVIARNSSFTYKGHAVDIKQVGRELGVRYVLEGSIRKGGNRLRVTAQLVEAESGNHIWAERYDRDLADIFAVQDEIAERVVAAIEPELYAAEHIRSQRKPPENLDAWECVIRALSRIGEGTRDADAQAEVLCRRAVAIAPDYGQAHSLLAWALSRQLFWTDDFSAVMQELNTEVALALRVDDRDPWAHFVQGIMFVRQRRINESLRAIRRALELNPNFALAHAFVGGPLVLHGERQEAIEAANQALRLSPNDRLVSVYALRSLTFANFALGQYQECVRWANEMIEKAPGQLPTHTYLVSALALQGETLHTREAIKAVFHLWPRYSISFVNENQPLVGEVGERVLKGLRLAGVPEG